MIPLALVMVDVFGKPVHLGEKATCLVFATVDCPISNAYQPLLGRLAASYSPRGVTFAQVFVDPTVAKADLLKHLSDFQVKWRAVPDPQHLLVKRIGAKVTPEAVVLDRDGEVVYQGSIDDAYPELGKRKEPTQCYLDLALKAVLAGKKPPVAKSKAVGCAIEELD